MMNATATAPAVADLILVRLLVTGTKPKMSDCWRQLSAFLPEPLDADARKKHVQELVAAGMLAQRPVTLTDAGRARALEFLGLPSLDAGTTWAGLVNRHLVPLALRLPCSDSRARESFKADGLAALVVKERFELEDRPESTLAEVLNALVCKELGFPEAMNLGEIKRLVLSRLVGSNEMLRLEQLRNQVPRVAAGAPRSGAAEIRKAILRRWLRGSAGGEAAESPQRRAEHPFDLGEFAATVKAVARDCPVGWFGDRKVFINHVWRHFDRQDELPAMELPEFKARLVEANRARLLDLSRADLPDKLPAADVGESETYQENAVFHFIQAERSRP
jgi:hypothetical protein